MIQAIMIGGFPAEYSIDTKNIVEVLGSGFIQVRVTYTDMLRIIYKGLKRTGGYTIDEFIAAVQKGEIYPSKSRKHYTISAMRPRILSRIKQVNREIALGKR